MAEYDPLCRASKVRPTLSQNIRDSSSHKCWDSRCIHYIYGFHSRDDRDYHAREHPFPTKREGNLSFGSSPALPFPEFSSRPYGGDHSRQSSTYQLPKPLASTQLPPLGIGTQSKDPKDTMPTFSFPGEAPSTSSRQQRGSIDSEVDPLLPPLKLSRVGKSRLQSIGELKLLKDVGPCLRCMVLNREVRGFCSQDVFINKISCTDKQQCDSSDTACALCADRAVQTEDFWRSLGCRRGSLVQFSDFMLPGRKPFQYAMLV